MHSATVRNTLHVSDFLSVHHQESKTVHTASRLCHTGSVAACMTYTWCCMYSLRLLMIDRETARNM